MHLPAKGSHLFCGHFDAAECRMQPVSHVGHGMCHASTLGQPDLASHNVDASLVIQAHAASLESWREAILPHQLPTAVLIACSQRFCKRSRLWPEHTSEF